MPQFSAHIPRRAPPASILEYLSSLSCEKLQGFFSFFTVFFGFVLRWAVVRPLGIDSQSLQTLFNLTL